MHQHLVDLNGMYQYIKSNIPLKSMGHKHADMGRLPLDFYQRHCTQCARRQQYKKVKKGPEGVVMVTVLRELKKKRKELGEGDICKCVF